MAMTDNGATGNAGDTFRVLYTADWNWRESLRYADEDRPGSTGAYLPSVDATSQTERTRRWTDVSAQLHAIPVAQLSAREQRIRLQRLSNTAWKGVSFPGPANRRYRGSFPVDARNHVRTVFRDNPVRRTISRTDTPSRKYIRLI